MPNASFNVRIDGLTQRIGALNTIISTGPTIQQRIVQRAGDFMSSEMKKNAHVMSGKMRQSVNYKIQGNSAIVSVPVPYAVYENRRVGTKPGFGSHNFADKAMDATMKILPNIIQQEVMKWTSNY